MRQVYIILIVLMLAACGAKEDPNALPPPTPAAKPQDVVWDFKPKGIQVTMESGEDINLVDEVPHALSVCIYQTADRDALVALASTKEGLLELLKCKAMPTVSVAATHRYVQPGSRTVFSLDRAKGATALAVVAGFNNLESESCFDITSMPIHKESSTTWYLGSNITYSAADMDARIFVSSNTIHVKGIKLVRK